MIDQCLAVWAPGPWEIGVILIVALLIFGRRLPEVMRGIGKSFSEFRKGINESFDAPDGKEKDS